MTDFEKAVYETVRRIKRGQTMTYKEVAVMIGRPRAYRAVGNALKKNYAMDIPCHRVIRFDGALGGYNSGASLKEKLLKEERCESGLIGRS